MKKTYFLRPSIPTRFTKDAVINWMTSAIENKPDAITSAITLSKQYNQDFFVCSLETKVSIGVQLVDLV